MPVGDAPLMVSTFSLPLPLTENIPLGSARMKGEGWAVESVPELNAVALWFGDAPPLVYFAVDALYPGPVLRKAAVESLGDVPEENILFAASHTHAAPMLDTTKPRLGVPDAAHLALVEGIVRDAARHLLDPANRSAGRIAASSGRADHSVNRRMVKRISLEWPVQFNKYRWAPDFWGKRDETVTVLKVEDDSGKPLCIIWNYACHPVMFPWTRTVSTHYVGAVRDQLRADAAEDGSVPGTLPVLFFQGFSGDIRPLYVAEPRLPEGPRQLYRRIRFGPVWRPEGEEKYKSWIASLTKQVSSIAKKTRPVPVNGARTARILRPRTDFVEPIGTPVSFQAQTLGEKIGIVAVSAELVVTYSHQARRDFHTKYTMPVGCVDEPVGYLPTAKMLTQGGYEAEAYLPYFELEALNPNVERNTRSALQEIIRMVLPSRNRRSS